MDYLFVLLSSHFQQRRAVPDVLLYPYYPHHLANLSRFKRSRVKFTAWCNQDALATSIFPTFLTSSYPSFSGLGVKLLVFFNSGDICCDICFVVFVISISRRFIPLSLNYHSRHFRDMNVERRLMRTIPRWDFASMGISKSHFRKIA